MNAQANSSLNGGSGGLAGGSRNITLGAGGLTAPAYRQERLKVVRRLLLAVVVLAAVNLVAAERDRNL